MFSGADGPQVDFQKIQCARPGVTTALHNGNLRASVSDTPGDKMQEYAVVSFSDLNKMSAVRGRNRQRRGSTAIPHYGLPPGHYRFYRLGPILDAPADSRVSVLRQLKNNAVAIASIFIALAGFAYTTWRDETSEANRNFRVAAFESLKQLNELQLITNAAHYKMDRMQGDPILGWSRVVMFDDLAVLLPPPAVNDAAKLHATWESNWQGLGHDQDHADMITDAISQSREHIAETLKRLK